MKAFWNGVIIAVAAVTLLLVGAGFGFNIGKDQERGALRCEEGTILSVRVDRTDSAGSGTYALDLGDCERIEEDAFVAAVQALVGFAVGSTTTTTTTPTTTTTVAPTATTTVAPTTSPPPPQTTTE